jgi:glutamate-ammonia-ligase adenylyltransferase
VTELTLELSHVADLCLEHATRLALEQIGERYGQPSHLDAQERWQPTPFCVIALGKLGGQELNFSSDVDVVFVYGDEGHVFKTPPRRHDPPRGLRNHEFFQRVAEFIIAEFTRLTDDGDLFRMDLRLRPEGDAGPLVRSLPSYENFYAQWGQTWERMMLIKSRCVAGDQTLGAEFVETIQTFRYPRSLGVGALREIAAMKLRLETDVVKPGDLERDVKRGRGGIREIEFVVQSLQLMHAGHQPFLQDSQTLSALQKLARYERLDQNDADTLTTAYVFLRDVEHRLQMEANQQTHLLPTARLDRERLAHLMGFVSLGAFENTYNLHRHRVHALYEKTLHSDEPAGRSVLPAGFQPRSAEWSAGLGQRGFRQPEQAARLFQTFAEGPGYVHVSARTTELAHQLIPKFLELCPPAPGTGAAPAEILSDPDRVLARLDTFIEKYGSRATLYELWTRNPTLFRLLLLLFDRSEHLAEVAIRFPDLVDDLEQTGQLRRSKNATEILADLNHGRDDADQSLWLRRYHQSEQMRIALREILGLADHDRHQIELSALARACVIYSLEVIQRRHRLAGPPFTIIGLGKLGGHELDYGSDLDVLFVSDAPEAKLPALQKLAAEFIALISERTEAGMLFPLDARLRPDGEKGLLVTNLRACAEYYRQRAQLWEIQALTRTGFVAGDRHVGEKFQRWAAELTDFRTERRDLAAWTPDWRAQIHHMRLRIEKERTPPGKDQLAIKTGRGGLVDAEFLAQALCLGQGWHEANTLAALEKARQQVLIPEAEAEKLITSYRELRRVAGILRRWSFAGEVLLPDDPAPQHRVAIRCGFGTTERMFAVLGEHRAHLRATYERFMSSHPISAPEPETPLRPRPAPAPNRVPRRAPEE